MKKLIKKILRESVKELEEVSDASYVKISENARVIMTNDDDINYKPTPLDKQPTEWHKPIGLWYAIGPSWVDWVRDNMPKWETENVFEIEIDKSKMLFLNSKEETDAFAEKYLGLYYNIPYINWKMVAQDYGGIEIGDDGLWGHFTHTWDIPSGCLWGENMILKVKKL
jgi:hypothetical protein